VKQRLIYAMMITPNNQLKPTRVAILVEQKFEDSEFQIPYQALKQTDAEVVVLGARMNDEYYGKKGNFSIKPDGTTTEAKAENFDAVIIPGGAAPDTMRNNPNTVNFVKAALEQGKLVAAVCHGPQVLIEGDLLQGKNATGFLSIQKDMENAGANYLDEPLVIHGNLITSRQPGDLAMFTTAILSRLGLKLSHQALPKETDESAEWWKVAAAFGGSSQGEIVEALNTALNGEHYSQQAFKKYADQTNDAEVQLLLEEIYQQKQHHIQLLEDRLAAFGESPSLSTTLAERLADINSWLSDNDDLTLLRHALGDIQTGVVDSYKLRKQYTDPISTAIFTQIENNLAHFERKITELYHQRLESESVSPPQPTVTAAV
jgi:protease I